MNLPTSLPAISWTLCLCTLVTWSCSFETGPRDDKSHPLEAKGVQMDIPLEEGRLEASAQKLTVTEDGRRLSLEGIVEVTAHFPQAFSITAEHLTLDTSARTLAFENGVKAVFSTPHMDGGTKEETFQ